MIQANELIRQKERLYQILQDATGQPRDVIEHDADRDFFLDAQKAVEYGIVDSVLSPVAVPLPIKG
jgi:ATP-dependent Clp protease protease subunit